MIAHTIHQKAKVLNIASFLDLLKSASIFLLLSSLSADQLFAQSTISNPNAEDIILGNYNPNSYAPSVRIYSKDSINDLIFDRISADSIQDYLTKLETFGNRNTGSDTVSQTRGIGAARRWIHQKFKEFSAAQNNRMEVGYLDFTINVCGMAKHRNVFAVLPGMDTTKKGVIVVEAHFDSRCEGSCDTACYAPGMDDNGSGTVLVLEAARVLSAMAFDRTIIFTTVTGEEQGLVGGEAWAGYLLDQEVEVVSCINNDVVGGIECGMRSSPPSCSPAGSIDSLNLRVFSLSNLNDSNIVSIHKQLARYTKLQVIEEVNPRLPFPINMSLQIRQDRQGRGGDHIPFNDAGFRAIRFCAAHEHGDGSGSAGDRQHTVTDVLGYDKSIPPDGILDTFLVDVHYLERNTLINAVNLAMLANSPPIPNAQFQTNAHGNVISIDFMGSDQNYEHRVGVRRRHSTDLYFDSIIDVTGHSLNVAAINPKGEVQLFAMNVEGEVESLPQTQFDAYYLDLGNKQEQMNCLKIYPNPAKDVIRLNWNCAFHDTDVLVMLLDVNGKEVSRSYYDSQLLESGINYSLQGLLPGSYFLQSIVNGDEIFTDRLVIE